MLDPAQQQRRTYWPGCRRRVHPWRPRGERWNRWFLTQSLVPSSKKLLPQQQDLFTEAFPTWIHQSSDLFPRWEWGEKWRVRWINRFRDVQAGSKGGGRYRTISAPLPLIGYNAQWLSVLRNFLSQLDLEAWPGTKEKLEVFWHSLWIENKTKQKWWSSDISGME